MPNSQRNICSSPSLLAVALLLLVQFGSLLWLWLQRDGSPDNYSDTFSIPLSEKRNATPPVDIIVTQEENYPERSANLSTLHSTHDEIVSQDSEGNTSIISMFDNANLTSSRVSSDDTAVYFNLNSHSYGVFSIYNHSQLVDDVLRTSDTLWLIGNWISLPKAKDTGKTQDRFVMDMVKLKKSEHSSMTIKLLITDSKDVGSGFHHKGFPLNKCLLQASKLLGSDNVYLASRYLVTGRDLGCFKDSQKCTTNTFLGDVNGTVLDYRNRTVANYIHNGVVAKWDFAVRDAYLPVYDQIIRGKLNLEANATISSFDFFNYDMVRVRDVAYMWDETNDGMSAFRNSVTRFMKTIIQQSNLTGLAGLVSARGKTGRRTTSDLYAAALLEHKIVVLAQRDRWEDHVRLCESLSAGAMVLSDPITFPPAGLVDGRNIVFYTSLEDLGRKILYYLKDERGCKERDSIAKAGRELVLSHQLSHHRFQRLMLRDNWPKSWSNPVAPLL